MTWPGTIRLATDADGPAIGRFFTNALFASIDWTRPGLGGWWLVADLGGEIRGAVLLVLSQPWASIGEIVVDPRERSGKLAGVLYISALAYAQHVGAQMILGQTVDPDLLRVLDRQGWVDCGQVHVIARGLSKEVASG